MKIIVKDLKKVSNIKFPCLMISYNHPKRVILMDGYSNDGRCLKGTILSQGSGTWGPGYYAENWRTTDFIPFKGEITLLNN